MGKSTLVRQFADQKKLTLHEINLERHPALVEVFKTQDTGKILRELEFICGKGPISGKDGLLFLDEIQAAPIAIQTLRYFYEDYPDLPVISAGSLLELTMSKHSFSMPVGLVEYLRHGKRPLDGNPKVRGGNENGICYQRGKNWYGERQPESSVPSNCEAV